MDHQSVGTIAGKACVLRGLNVIQSVVFVFFRPAMKVRVQKASLATQMTAVYQIAVPRGCALECWCAMRRLGSVVAQMMAA